VAKVKESYTGQYLRELLGRRSGVVRKRQRRSSRWYGVIVRTRY
jgi:hypothetical protein